MSNPGIVFKLLYRSLSIHARYAKPLYTQLYHFCLGLLVFWIPLFVLRLQHGIVVICETALYDSLQQTNHDEPVGLMNSCKAQVEEIIFAELIFA